MTEFDLLRKPEYLHVLLNHLPIYGIILGASALAISLAVRSRAAQITALILTLIAGASTYPVFVTGQPGGRVRHPEFRQSEIPAPTSESDRSDKQ